MGKPHTNLALLGRSGAGKDTFVSFLKNHSALGDRNPHVLRLAEPLYAGQESIYKLCGIPLDPNTQDGTLLNFLGQHMRKINPAVLKEVFAHKLSQSENSFVICPDARPVDIIFLKDLGFKIIHIDVSPELAYTRRIDRKDYHPLPHDAPIEEGLEHVKADWTLSNTGTLEAFHQSITPLLAEIL